MHSCRKLKAGQTQDLLQRTEVIVICSERFDQFCSKASRSSSQSHGGFDQDGLCETDFKKFSCFSSTWMTSDRQSQEASGFAQSIRPSPTSSFTVSLTDPTNTNTLGRKEASLQSDKAPKGPLCSSSRNWSFHLAPKLQLLLLQCPPKRPPCWTWTCWGVCCSP